MKEKERSPDRPSLKELAQSALLGVLLIGVGAGLLFTRYYLWKDLEFNHDLEHGWLAESAFLLGGTLSIFGGALWILLHLGFVVGPVVNSRLRSWRVALAVMVAGLAAISAIMAVFLRTPEGQAGDSTVAGGLLIGAFAVSLVGCIGLINSVSDLLEKREEQKDAGRPLSEKLRLAVKRNDREKIDRLLDHARSLWWNEATRDEWFEAVHAAAREAVSCHSLRLALRLCQELRRKPRFDRAELDATLHSAGVAVEAAYSASLSGTTHEASRLLNKTLDILVSPDHFPRIGLHREP